MVSVHEADADNGSQGDDGHATQQKRGPIRSMLEEDCADILKVAVIGINGGRCPRESAESLLIPCSDKQRDPGLERIVLVRRGESCGRGQHRLLLRGFKTLGEEGRQLVDLLLIETHTAR